MRPLLIPALSLALGAGVLGAAAVASHAQAQPYWRPFYSNSYVRYRCDPDGDRCAYYRCDPDGDRCERVSARWTRDYGRQVQYRCDRDGDRCAYFRCDPDGDRCDRISDFGPNFAAPSVRYRCDPDGDRCSYEH